MLEVLRHIVQEVGHAAGLEDALSITVRRVKEALAVDVCSVYLFDAVAGEYVLRATDGLNPDAVGRVRMRPGEGLVGLVAERQEPVHVREAASHPRFRYFPETGEELYHAFLGVPLIHYRQVLGVLVAQQRGDRLFGSDESAFLVTIGAQLAGAINHVAVVGGVATLLAGRAGERGYIEGKRAAEGIAIGTAVVVAAGADLDAIEDRPATEPDAEIGRLNRAIAAVQDDIRLSGERLGSEIPAAEKALFDVYVMLLDGDTLSSDMAERIRAGQWAPAAVRDTVRAHARVFETMDDPYLSARAGDIRELGRRIVKRLEADAPPRPREYPEHSVLIGDDLGITDIADAPRARLAGIVSARGSAFSHTAILARAMGVPAVVDVGDLPLARLAGRTIVVDGHRGRMFVDPSPAVLAEFRRLARADERLGAELRGLRDLPAETPDGVRVNLYVNTGLLSDLGPSLDSGAEGVGLYRTEFPFLIRESFPGEDEQAAVYREVLAAFAPRPVTMRTLDIGGDKVLPYFYVTENNPFLGWRGIRVTLDHPEIFLTQLRAMLRADLGLGNLRILLPLVSTVAEIDDALGLLERARAELAEEGLAVRRPPVGAMIEVPAAVYQAARIARRMDFLSIGSNDLTQYLLAVDRTNARVADLYDNLHPAVLAAVASTLRAGIEAGCPVSVCGDMAGEPAGVVLLLGMGYRQLSMTTAYIGRAKRVVRTITSERARVVLEQALAMESAAAVRRLVREELERAGLGELVRGP